MNTDYGLLLNEQNIKYQRRQFNEMVRLYGVYVKYYDISNKQFNNYSEIVGDINNWIRIGVIFTDHID